MVGRQILRLRYTVNEWVVGILLECILVNAGHRRFICRRRPNLNLRQFSESESDSNSTHRRFKSHKNLGKFSNDLICADIVQHKSK